MTLVGTDKKDNLTGTSGDDTISGRGGNDTIDGGKGDDLIDGGDGNDTIEGGDGNDTIYGGAGNDKIDGGKGDDIIDGGDGNDTIEGGDGNDTINGGAGNDNIDGGKGIDVAVYSGNFSDYKLTLSHDGGHHGDDDDDHSAMTVHDKRVGKPDGVDVLKNVEILRFADGEYRDGHFYPNGGGNTNPVALADAVATLEDTPLIFAAASLTANDSDADGDSLTVTAVHAGANTHGSVVFNSATGNITYTPDADYFGPASFSYTVSDGRGGTATGTVTVDVGAVNDAAVISGDIAGAVTEAGGSNNTSPGTGPATGTLTNTDVDNPDNTFQAVTTASASDNGYGKYTISTGGAWTYTLNEFNATVQGLSPTSPALTDTFTVHTADGTPQQVTVTINGANDATVISPLSGPPDYVVGVDPPVVLAPALVLSDPDNDSVTSATVAIRTGFVSGNDYLTADPGTVPSGWTVSYSGGELLITGDGTMQQYQDILRSVKFYSSSASSEQRVFSFIVSDHGIDSAVVDTSTKSLDYLGTTGFKLPGVAANDFSGFSVSSAGDVNGDGYADVIVGAPFADPNGDRSGSSYVVFGGSFDFDPEVFLASVAPGSAPGSGWGFRIDGAAARDFAGFSVSKAGDVNGDGIGDLIIGASDAAPNGTQSGASYVVYGRPEGFSANVQLSTLQPSEGFKISGVWEYDRAGYSVSTAGDVNGDGLADLIIGAVNANGGGFDTDGLAYSGTGAAYVVFGRNGGFSGNLELSDLNGTNGFQVNGIFAYDRAGDAVSAAGDVNGDGFGDLIIGATNAGPNGSLYSGEVYVVFGKAGPFTNPLDPSTLSGSDGFRISGAGDYAYAGYAVSSAGDVNGDGFGDLIIGAPYAYTTNGFSGAAYVIFGKESWSDGVVDLAALGTAGGVGGFSILGVADGDRAGYSVSAAGDVNGDGYADLIVGAPDAKLGGQPAGESYVIFGRPTGSGDPGYPTSIDLHDSLQFDQYGFSLSAVGLGDASGYDVRGAGDVNGDGFDDMVVGAAYASPDNVSSEAIFRAGESYVIFGSKFIVGTNTHLATADQPGVPGIHELQGNLDALGNPVNDTFIGSREADTMYGNGGRDAYSAGAGDDTIHMGASGSAETSYLRINGGSGIDTLALDGEDMILDLTAPGADRISGIERIDLTGSGDNRFILDIRDLLNLSDTSNSLQIDGNSGDAVNVKLDPGASAWTQDADQSIGALSYHSYTEGLANLLIHPDVVVTFS